MRKATSLSHQDNKRMPQVAIMGTRAMGTAMRLQNRSAETDVDVWSWHHPSTAPFVNRAATAHDKAAAASAVLVPTVVSPIARRHGADSTSVIAAAASRSLQRGPDSPRRIHAVPKRRIWPGPPQRTRR
jgi:hypothetical protein